MRYDAVIIGGGANGLTAAAMLARAGMKVLVAERAQRAGGRLVTDEFHPGFAASPFADRAPEIPLQVLDTLGIAPPRMLELPPEDIRARRDGALAQIFAETREPYHHTLLARLRRTIMPPVADAAWPGQDLAARPLADWPHLTAWALLGRASDPDLMGSALSLLAVAGAAPVRGGLGVLGESFIGAASGAQLQLGAEVSEVEIVRGRLGSRVAGIVLADGSRIEADAVISTLDFKRSILSLFPWAALPPAMTAAAAQFRMAGGTARLLLALKRRPSVSTPLMLAADGQARAAFRRGAVPVQPPLLLDSVSLRDPGLAPEDGATLTVTLSCIPARLFDGAWTPERRHHLAAGALARIETVLPCTLASLAGICILTPSDMEARLGVTDGDLDGGALSPDQMLGWRPGPRTALPGFYLGGASTAAGPLGTGAAGHAAATALLADRR